MNLYLINEETAALVRGLCDLALRAGGVQNLERVQVVLAAMSTPVSPEVVAAIAIPEPAPQEENNNA